MKNLILFISFLILIVTSSICAAQENPLFSNSQPDTSKVIEQDNIDRKVEVEDKGSENRKRIIVLNKFLKKNADIQRKIRDELALLSADYKKEKSSGAFILIFLFAFLYGIFHSLGPGHGKVFVFSYILTEKPKILKAISTSYAIALVHGISGLLVALIIIFSLKTYTSESTHIDNASVIISRISFGLISAIGIYLLLKSLLNKGYSHNHNESSFQFLPFVISVGLVPCPGTIILVTFLSSMGLLGIGIISSLFIILGMGISISFIAIISLFSKKLATSLFPDKSKNYEKTYRLLSLGGAILLILFGVLFFVGTYSV